MLKNWITIFNFFCETFCHAHLLGLDGRDGIPGEPGLDGVPGAYYFTHIIYFMVDFIITAWNATQSNSLHKIQGLFQIDSILSRFSDEK